MDNASLKGTLLEGGGQCESEGDAIGGRWTMQ